MKVLFMGHSFVKRFDQYCRHHTIHNGGIDHEMVDFSTIGRGGAGVPFARDCAAQIKSLQTKKIILQT